MNLSVDEFLVLVMLACLCVVAYAVIAEMIHGIQARPERTRDARRVAAETWNELDRLSARSLRALEPGTESGVDGAELGIGAAVLPPDARLRSRQGPKNLAKQRGRVLRATPWVVDDSGTYTGTSVVKKRSVH